MPRISPIKRKKFQKFLAFVGCKLKRTKGDHLIYDRPDLERPVVITADSEVPTMIIRSNLRTLNISPEEFLKMLKRL